MRHHHVMRALCLGEAIVDLVCKQAVSELDQARSFVPFCGGVAANIAVTTVRNGADAALAGGVGDDQWGHWLHDRLVDEGILLTWFRLIANTSTPLAFVTVDAIGEPTFTVHGAGGPNALAAISEDLPTAVEQNDALLVTSNTLVGDREFSATLTARDRALELGRPIVFDLNLRLPRWRQTHIALSRVRDLITDTFLVKCNLREAQFITKEPDPSSCARAILAAGARSVIITLGGDGAILRGHAEIDAPAPRARIKNTSGAGDTFTGVILARLLKSEFDPSTLVSAVPAAIREATRATERWAAV
jgi:sugar/nucleoside kinase (ribokinase family)